MSSGNTALDNSMVTSQRPSSLGLAMPFELAVIVPTYNEQQNIALLVNRLEAILGGISWECIVVDDDSPDDTAGVVRGLAQRMPNVRCLQRIGRRGLSRAVIEGVMATCAPYAVVIDGDLQHDERIIPEMIQMLRGDTADVVVGSRYVSGGGVSDWDARRVWMSRLATAIAKRLIRVEISDPMSGFFAFRTEAFRATVRRLSGEGYKILLDFLSSASEPLCCRELAYTFNSRQFGESKLDAAVLWEYFALIIDKTIGRLIPTRFVLFSIVGSVGVVVHFAVLAMLMKTAGIIFSTAQTSATMVAMTGNFILNNVSTYRDKRRRGWKFLYGLLSFYAVCGLGVVANVGVANAVFEKEYSWWVAGAAGILVGVVWNYAASSVFTWRVK